jgi:hypothetical protein
VSAESADRLAFVVLCGFASLAAGGGFATRTPDGFAALAGCGRLRGPAHVPGCPVRTVQTCSASRSGEPVPPRSLSHAACCRPFEMMAA